MARRPSRRARGVLVLVAASALVASLTAAGRSTVRAAGTAVLVQLARPATQAERALVEAAGGERVSGAPRLWRVPAGRASEVVRALSAGGAVALAEPERIYVVQGTVDFEDPLVPEQWWRTAIGIAGISPPPPGIPISFVDSGLRLEHPEFAGRPNVVAVNAQEPTPLGGVHGTAVASVAGAPVNGVGLVGVYPEAVIRSYDAAIGDGTQLRSGDIVSGILATARAGRTVINLSLGGDTRDRILDDAVYRATRAGALVVAASGNSGEQANTLSYPGASAHVVTVAATGRTGRVASFSTRSPWVDIAAPGVEIPIASAVDDGFDVASGTSFAAPIVAAAAAWVWTVRPELDAGQVAEILTRSARDVEPPGVDQATGYGILDVPAALAYPTPARDPGEPNDDVDAIAPTTLTARGRPGGTASGSVAVYEDPRDVFRVWIPANRTLTATVSADAAVAVSVYADTAQSVIGPLGATHRLARSSPSTRTTLGVAPARAGRVAYLVVAPARGTRTATYTADAAVR